MNLETAQKVLQKVRDFGYGKVIDEASLRKRFFYIAPPNGQEKIPNLWSILLSLGVLYDHIKDLESKLAEGSKS